MTSSVEIIGAEITRLVNKLPEIDPVVSPEMYHRTIDMAHNLMSLGERIDNHNRCAELTPVCTCNELPKPVFIPHTPEHPVDNVTPFPEPSTEEYVAPVMDDPNVLPATKPEPGPEPAKTYSMPEVRAALAQSRKKGVNVNEFLQGLGYDNFTAVPAAKYGEVMAELEKL